MSWYGAQLSAGILRKYSAHRKGSIRSRCSNGLHLNLLKTSSNRGSVAIKCCLASSNENVSTAGTSAGASPLFLLSTGRIVFGTVAVSLCSSSPVVSAVAAGLVFFLDAFGAVSAFLFVLAAAC